LDSSAYFTSEHPLFRRVVGVAPALLLTLRLDMALVGSLVFLFYNLFSAIALHWNQKKSTARLVVLTLVTASVIVLAELVLWFLHPELWEQMAIPLRLMIPSSVVFLSAWDSSKNTSLWQSVQALVVESISMGMAVILLAVFRESLGFGRISLFTFSLEIPYLIDNPLEILQFPGAMLIVAGILMAGYHFLYTGQRKVKHDEKMAQRRAVLQANLAGKSPKPSEPAMQDSRTVKESIPNKVESPPVAPRKPEQREPASTPEQAKSVPQSRTVKDTESEKKTEPSPRTDAVDRLDSQSIADAGQNSSKPSTTSRQEKVDEEKPTPSSNAESRDPELASASSSGTVSQESSVEMEAQKTASESSLSRSNAPQTDPDFPRPYGHILQLLQEQSTHPQIRILVLGSAKGLETYKIAMDLMISDGNSAKDFYIRAVDEQIGFVQMAQGAVYPESDWEDLPESWKSRFLLRNKDPQKTLVKLVNDLVQKVEFLNQPIVLGDNFAGEAFSLIWLRQPLDILGPGERAAMYDLIREALLPGHYFLSDFEMEEEEKEHWQALSENLWKKKG
jgi:Na+-transporting NADH:ubiquinone oxidoreductase subunit NqrD